MKGAAVVFSLVVAACAPHAAPLALGPDPSHADTIFISNMARELSSDAMRGRGPWTRENERVAPRPDARLLVDRLKLLIEVDAGSPAGEALEWQLVGGSPAHSGTRLADSLARARGWTTTSTPPRAISDFHPFAQHGVRTLFPIPGKTWKGYTDAQRAEAMKKFDHYHDPKDEWRPDF